MLLILLLSTHVISLKRNLPRWGWTFSRCDLTCIESAGWRQSGVAQSTLADCLASWETEDNYFFLISSAKWPYIFTHRAHNAATTTRHLSTQQQRGQRLFGAILDGLYLAKVFSMLALTDEDTGCVSYRDDMNLLCWAPPDSPQARHCNLCLYASNPLLISATLSILCVCFLLYLLTVLNKPRRSAEAAIFPPLARSHTRMYSTCCFQWPAGEP